MIRSNTKNVDLSVEKRLERNLLRWWIEQLKALPASLIVAKLS